MSTCVGIAIFFSFFFFNDTATTEIYTLSLHDALPICTYWGQCAEFCGHQHANMRLVVIAEPEEKFQAWLEAQRRPAPPPKTEDRKSTRLNSSHANISYAVFCLKKKKKKLYITREKNNA